MFHYTDVVTTVLFIVDYLLRWLTADYRDGERSFFVFVKYPFTPWGIIDLLSILPTLTVLNSSLKLFRCLMLSGKPLALAMGNRMYMERGNSRTALPETEDHATEVALPHPKHIQQSLQLVKC